MLNKISEVPRTLHDDIQLTDYSYDSILDLITILHDKGAYTSHCEFMVPVTGYKHIMPDKSLIQISLSKYPALSLNSCPRSLEALWKRMHNINGRFVVFHCKYEPFRRMSQLPDISQVHYTEVMFNSVRKGATAACNGKLFSNFVEQLNGASYCRKGFLHRSTVLLMFPLPKGKSGDEKIFGVNVGGVCVPVRNNRKCSIYRHQSSNNSYSEDDSDIHPNRTKRTIQRIEETDSEHGMYN